MQNNLKQQILKILKVEKLNKRLIRPVLLDSAKGAGYSVKNSFAVVTRYRKGNHRHPLPTKGRTHTKYYSWYSAKLSHLDIATKRIAQKYKNCNAKGYYLFKHACYNYYQVIFTLK